MACSMTLRLVAARAMRCHFRNDIHLIGKNHFGLYIRSVGQNLKPSNNKNIFCANYQQFRCKWKRKNENKKDEDSESDDDNDYNTRQALSKDSEDSLEPGTKIISYKLDSARIDRLLRKALNLSGKGVEDLFYDKKIHLNDGTLIKKSQEAEEGDIITVPLKNAPGSIAFGAVIEILEIKENTNGITVKIARNKNTRVAV